MVSGDAALSPAKAEAETPTTPSTPKRALVDLNVEDAETPTRRGDGTIVDLDTKVTPSKHPPPTVPIALTSISECLYGLPEEEESLYPENLPDEIACQVCEVEEDGIWQRQFRMQGHVVDMAALRRISSSGIPDEGSHRGVVWRLLMGYLPIETEKWVSKMQEKRNAYHKFCQEYFADTFDCERGDRLRGQRKMNMPTAPLILTMDEDSYHSYHSTATLDMSEADEISVEGGAIVERLKEAAKEDVLSKIPENIKDAWTDRGKDLHLLQSLMRSANALKISNNPVIEEESTQEDEAAESKPPPNVSGEECKQFISSALLLDEIHKDVIRTHSDLAFFLDPHNELGRRRYAAIERILFIWAKCNTGVRYVQGMNEIVGALYYVLANDWRLEWANSAEADAYWLFNTLLSDMKDVFVPDLDKADTGIKGRIDNMQSLLARHDPEVMDHLRMVGVDATFYAIRWLTTLLSREFLLPDTIRLWDSMFASTHKENFMRYVCVTMVFVIREELLTGDFSACIKLLQGYPPTQVDGLIESSRSLWIYETQISLACHRGGLTRHVALQTIKPPASIIMAFGFRRGIAPKTTAELMEEAGERAAQRVRGATTAVASSARNLYKNIFSRSRKVESSSATGQTTTTTELPDLKNDEDDVYMSAILSS